MRDVFKELAVIFHLTEPQCAFELFAFVDSSLMPFHQALSASSGRSVASMAMVPKFKKLSLRGGV
ncbi:hypothetical protein [Bartonella tribocorum]|uniref:hypothetical protein n=1 Tax=Bartonella tribocorum TaxID=85701 RepID=UPI0002D69F4B|nr:hypothetical protein BM1374166_01879 [Bartonella tribocorum]